MTDDANELGAFLRARRELVTPDAVGIPVLGVRRVAGLRREEVAMLAGISADYYLRLEQGRDRNPSTQVLESIARVLQLDADTTAYLLDLAAPRPRRVVRRRRSEPVPAHTVRFVERVPFPAFVEDRYLDVVAANDLARMVSPRLVVGFRQSVGTDTADPRYIELVGELSLASPEFRRLWARHEIRPPQGAEMALMHPQVGELHVDREKLAIGGTDGMVLVVYHVAPGSADAEKLAMLASMTATGVD